MSRHHRQGGFTLVETLVALAMLSGVLVATYAALSQALATAVRLHQRAAAVAAVEQQAAALRLRPAGSMPELRGETPAYRWRLSAAALPGAPAAARAAAVPYRLLGVVIRKAGAGHGEVVLDTIILGRGA